VQVMGYYFKGLCGVLGAVISLCWILHIVLYMFVSPPVTPFLNDLFVELDGVFSLFGTVAFALFCFYLLCCVMKGNMTLGLNLIVFTVRSQFVFPPAAAHACGNCGTRQRRVHIAWTLQSCRLSVYGPARTRSLMAANEESRDEGTAGAGAGDWRVRRCIR
jgi:hypothetical protein